MSLNEVLPRLATATPEQLEAVSSLLDGKPQTTATRPQDMRLLTMLEVCQTLGLSRMSVWRLTRAGKLRTIETIGGGLRVPAWALEQFAGKAV
jgi:excisionase family DNA binding protein